LDGLRAASIAVVVIDHLGGNPGFPNWPSRLPIDGLLGVRVFFSLSGFLITRLLLRERDRTGRVSLAGFYRRRAVRILPVFWVYLLFVVALRAIGVEPMPAWQLLPPLTFTNFAPWWPSGAQPWVVAHSWSLAVEEQFYLIWPAVVAATAAALPRSPRARSAVLLAGLTVTLFAEPVVRYAVCVHARQAWLTRTAVANFDFIAWGCLLAVLWHDRPRAVGRFFAWHPSLGRLAAVAVVLWTPWYVRRLFPLPFVWAAWSLPAAATTYLIGSLVEVRRGICYRALNARPVVWLGLVSYSLYVWQEAFVGNGPTGHLWRQWPLNVALAVAAAFASYRLVERPSQQYRRRAGHRSPDGQG
jgi:peptidoglycan/LPS O-acetylase OafA/YrhL